MKEGDVDELYNWCSSNKFKSHLTTIHKTLETLYVAYESLLLCFLFGVSRYR